MGALIEPFFYCLFASVIWAPLVFFAARQLCAGAAQPVDSYGSISGKVWPLALVLAALPVLLAPFAASLGLSLRAAAPLPPMADIAAPALATTALPEPAPIAATTTVSLADILRASAVLYFYGFIMLMALAVIRHIWFAYRLNFAAPIDTPALEAKLDAWRRRIGVNRQPRYVFSHVVSSVCVYGFFRPVIVMPDNLLDRVSIEDAALMGAHEMAHVKRGDVALFALCSAVKAVFWFNPFTHRICARANLAAEQGADALVLASGVDRRQYAHCFVQGLKFASGAAPNRFAGELVPSFTPFDKRSRRARLDAILSGAPQTPSMSWPARLSLTAAAALACVLAFAQAALAVAPPPPRDALPVAPVEGKITFGYGQYSKKMGPNRIAHEGVDIKAATGTPVRAAGPGKVIDATDNYSLGKNWGNVVVVDHGHGLVTRYAHLDSFIVKKGDKVKAGDVIGAVGATGKVTGPHLHFEVIKDGETIDPTPVVAAAPEPALAPAPAVRTNRRVQIAPDVDAASIAPRAPAVPKVDHDAEIRHNTQNAHKLEKRFAKMTDNLRARFENFDAFEELDGVFISTEDLESVEALSEALEDQFDIDVDTAFAFASPEGMRFEFNGGLTDEQRAEIDRAREDAKKQARKAAAQAKQNIARAKEDAKRIQRQAFAALERDQKEFARAAAASERARERAMEAAERTTERALADSERERERAIEEMEREIDHQIDRAEREAERAMKHSEADALAAEEKALREANVEIQERLKEIRERKRELARRER